MSCAAITSGLMRARSGRSSIAAAAAYEIDGMVIKVNSKAIQDKCGYTAHHPRWAPRRATRL